MINEQSEAGQLERAQLERVAGKTTTTLVEEKCFCLTPYPG